MNAPPEASCETSRQVHRRALVKSPRLTYGLPLLSPEPRRVCAAVAVDLNPNALSRHMHNDSEDTAIDIAHLAKLARLALVDDLAASARTDLQKIVTMIDHMQSIDTDDIEPMAHPGDANLRLRADAITEQVDRTALQANAPELEEGYFLVPRVVE